MIDKLGFTGIVVIAILAALYTIAILKKTARVSEAKYIKGTSLGLAKSVKGNIILKYEFIVNGVKYKGFVPGSFCDKCKSCCGLGNAVNVRYQLGNPENNDLVLSVNET